MGAEGEVGVEGAARCAVFLNGGKISEVTEE